MKFFFFFFFVFFLVFVLLVCLFFVSFSYMFSYDEKSSSFECGFYSFGGGGFSFSMPFFVISLMFLLFDVEILLVCFFPFVGGLFYYSSFFIWYVLSLIFFCTIYEWFKGLLSWV